MSGMTASAFFWLTLLYSVWFTAVADTSLTNEPKCINGIWKAGECVCNLGYKTVHEIEDVSGALQPVYCNTTVQIVLGPYQWTEQDVLQLAAADVSSYTPCTPPCMLCVSGAHSLCPPAIILNHEAEMFQNSNYDTLTVTQLVVVLATASCLVLIHLFGFLIRLHVTAQKLNKLKLREKAFLDYTATYHQEKQFLPTLWTPPSTFQLLNADGTSLFIGTGREKGEDVTEPHQSCIEESDNETLQTRFIQTLEKGQSDGTEQEHATLSLWHSNCSLPEIEEATPRTSIKTGTHSKAHAIKPERKAQAEPKECSRKRVKRPKNARRDKGTRKHSCSMDMESQEISQQPKKTKRGKGDKEPRRRGQSMRKDSQDKCEQKEEKDKNKRQTLN